jgi:hypothetical protein
MTMVKEFFNFYSLLFDSAEATCADGTPAMLGKFQDSRLTPER